MPEPLTRLQAQTKDEALSYDALLDLVQEVVSNPIAATKESVKAAEDAIRRLRFLRGGDR